jgi:hypothetical protein
LGSSTLRLNTSGSNNTAVGTSTLFNNVTGSENTAIGSNAGRYFGSGTSANVDPSASVFIGRNTRANASGETNQIVIGMNALGLGSNTVVLGNDNIITTVLKGNVGIGTTIPNAKLDISGSVNISGSGVQVPLQVSSGNNSLLFVSQSGNVGIGTTSPGAKLDVNVTGNNTALKLTRDAGVNGVFDIDFDGANTNFNSLYAYTFQTGNTERMRITSGGNVGIGRLVLVED